MFQAVSFSGYLYITQASAQKHGLPRHLIDCTSRTFARPQILGLVFKYRGDLRGEHDVLQVVRSRNFYHLVVYSLFEVSA